MDSRTFLLNADFTDDFEYNEYKSEEGYDD